MIETPARTTIAAATAFAAALFVCGSALVRAIHVDATPSLPSSSVATTTDHAGGTRDGALTMEAMMLAVEADPFSPARQPPAERYRLPGDVEPVVEPPPALPPIPAFQLRGTLVDAADGASAALIQLGEEPARLLPIGASLGGFRLTQVMPQSALMTDGSRELMLRVPGPLQTVPIQVATPQQGRRGREPVEMEVRERAAEEVRQNRQQLMQMMQALEQARERGASAEVLEALQRAIRQRQGGNVPTRR